jgi:type IV pilus assembly protein PilZ
MSHLIEEASARRRLPCNEQQRTKVIVDEKRGHPRVDIDVDVVCRRPDGTEFVARAVNISMGGMFLESEHSVSFGGDLRLEFTPPGARKALSLPAVVRWIERVGFGVQFGLIGARETHALSELVRR